MTTLKQHFFHIKRMTDWSWTIALLCLVGYLSFGQIAQIYFAMIFFGGLAGSFSVFYKISCQKIEELDSFNLEELEKSYESVKKAEKILKSYVGRNKKLSQSEIVFDDLIEKVYDIQYEIKNEIHKEKTLLNNISKIHNNASYTHANQRSNTGGRIYVKGHHRNGKWIKPHWRSKKKR